MACEYCKKNGNVILDTNMDDTGEEGIRVSISPIENTLLVEARFEAGCVGEDAEMFINFCPMCGRKLED